MRLLREVRSHALLRAGVYRRRLRREPFPGVAVLAYHGVRDDGLPRAALRGGALHVSAGRLAEHCEILRALCHPISGQQFLDATLNGCPLPPRPVLVTFDDGYANCLTHALPVLERFEMPAVLFACPDPIARSVRFWFDAVAEKRGDEAVVRAKTLPYDAWRAEVQNDEMPAGADDPHRPLTVAELARLAQSALIEVGGHTLTHPILANAPPADQQREIAGSADALRAWLGTSPRLFAYPNGRPGVDYTLDTVATVRASYQDGFAVGEAFTSPVVCRGEQRRFLMLDSISGPELAHRLAGAWPREAWA